MLGALLGVLLQSGPTAPHVGFLLARNGRVYPVYGVRGAFVLGAGLEPDVIAAVRFGSALAEKTAAELRVNEDGRRSSVAAKGTALFAVDSATSTLYAWIPDERRMLAYSRGVFWAAKQHPPDGEIVAISAREGKLRWLAGEAGRPAGTLDPNGNLWTVSGPEVHCGTQRWPFDQPVQSTEPLGDGWVLLRTASAWYAARCGLPELYEIPNPEAFPPEGQ
jgi:hypothetical protein